MSPWMNTHVTTLPHRRWSASPYRISLSPLHPSCNNGGAPLAGLPQDFVDAPTGAALARRLPWRPKDGGRSEELYLFFEMIGSSCGVYSAPGEMIAFVFASTAAM